MTGPHLHHAWKAVYFQHEQHHSRCTGAPKILGYNHTCSYCCTAMISINNARLHNNCRLHRSLYFCQLCPCSMQRRRARHCHILSSCLLPIMCYHSPQFQVFCTFRPFFTTLALSLLPSRLIRRARANLTRFLQACICCLVAGGELCTAMGCCSMPYKQRSVNRTKTSRIIN